MGGSHFCHVLELRGDTADFGGDRREFYVFMVWVLGEMERFSNLSKESAHQACLSRGLLPLWSRGSAASKGFS